MAKENYYELKALELFRQYVGKGLVLNNEESKNLFLLAFSLGLTMWADDAKKIYAKFEESVKNFIIN